MKEGAPKFAVEKPKEVEVKATPEIKLSQQETDAARLSVDLFESEEEKTKQAERGACAKERKLRMIGRAACTALALIAVFVGMESARAQSNQSKWQRIQRGLEIGMQVKNGFDEASKQRLNQEHDKDIRELQFNYDMLLTKMQQLDNKYQDKNNPAYINARDFIQHGSKVEFDPKTGKPLTMQMSLNANLQARRIIDLAYQEDLAKMSNSTINTIGRGLGGLGGLGGIGLGSSGGGRPYGGGDLRGKKIGL